MSHVMHSDDWNMILNALPNQLIASIAWGVEEFGE